MLSTAGSTLGSQVSGAGDMATSRLTQGDHSCRRRGGGGTGADHRRAHRVADHRRSVRRAGASERCGDAGAVCEVRPSLEEIVDMIEQDQGIQRLAPDFTRPEPAPIPPERLADYGRACKRPASPMAFPIRRDHRVHRLDAAASPSAAAARASSMPSTPMPMRRWSMAISMRRRHPDRQGRTAPAQIAERLVAAARYALILKSRRGRRAAERRGMAGQLIETAASIAKTKGLKMTTPLETESNLWPTVLLFGLTYLGVSAVVTAVLVGFDINANNGIAIGILVAATAVAAREFVLDHRRALRRGEQVRFAFLALVALVPITIIQAVVVVPFAIGKDEMQAFIVEAQAWIAGNTGPLVFIIAFVAILYFAILYFASGWFSRWFAKRLAATGKT